MIKYVAKKLWGEIKEVEVKSETAKFVTLPNGQRCAKRGYDNYFDSRQEAIDWLISQKQSEVTDAGQRLQKLESKLLALKEKFA